MDLNNGKKGAHAFKKREGDQSLLSCVCGKMRRGAQPFKMKSRSLITRLKDIVFLADIEKFDALRVT